MKIIFAVIFALSFAVVGCKQELNKESTDLAYNFDDNGCKTGAHSFDSKASYCQGLKDDVLNNGCAYSMRKVTYESECGTDWAFWPGVETNSTAAAQ